MTERIRQLPAPAIQAAVMQALILLFCAGFRDGGVILTGAMLGSLAFWYCGLVGLCSSDNPPSRLQRFFVGWALLPYAGIGAVLFHPVSDLLAG